MQPFTTLTAIAAPLPLANVDTDMIIPKQFLKTIKRTGLGAGLFYEMRFDEQGKPKPFVLDTAPYTQAQILVTGQNFGCGSSREHAPWALLDFGIRCVIAPSFADIFFNNCFKNGILPIVIPQENVDTLMQAAQKGKKLTVDLQKQQVTTESGSSTFTFKVDDFRRNCLLKGLDDIGLTLEKESKIAAFEAKQKTEQPWMYG